ncbi:reverse transcriptase domain-containing protein [Tanacetum coccineum]
MADNRTMAQLLQAPTEGYEDAIVIPEINANFELKHGLINLVQNKQFLGHDKEDPHAHIRYFNKITSTMRFPDIPSTSIKLMLFLFSLEGSARIWLEKEPPRSILTWDDLVSKFINQFFPPSKMTNLRNEITRFQQRFDESFYEAWDRFNDLLRACPHHGFNDLLWRRFRGGYFKPDPRVPLILGRCFLKTSRTLIDVYEGELTLQVGNEAITYNLDQTSRYSINFNDMTANRIDVVELACEEYSKEVIGFLDDFLLLEEVDAFLALADDPTSPEVDESYYDPEGGILILEALLNKDYEPAVQHQRRVNPKIHDVIKKEVEKLLDAGLIYPISDSPWVIFKYQSIRKIRKKPHSPTHMECLLIAACLLDYAMHQARSRGV